MNVIDLREIVINVRFEGVKWIILVVSGKGGVGKFFVLIIFVFVLVEKGYRVGFFDFDFYGVSDYVIFGFEFKEFFEEDRGVVLLIVYGIKFMIIVYYMEDRFILFCGKEISDVLIELFMIICWDELDYFVIDMLLGFGD